jgi:hypothetical protein
LALQIERYEKKEKRLGYAQLCALLPTWKREHEFLSAVPAQALQNLERAYTNFFQKRAEFPKFKKKSRHDSFRIPQGFALDPPKVSSLRPGTRRNPLPSGRGGCQRHQRAAAIRNCSSVSDDRYFRFGASRCPARLRWNHGGERLVADNHASGV